MKEGCEGKTSFSNVPNYLEILKGLKSQKPATTCSSD